MRKIILFIIPIFVAMFWVVSPSFAQQTDDKAMEEEARGRGITFPIAELGNCANVSQCREYCSTPANHQACSEYARKKGFQEERREEAQMSEDQKKDILEKAKTDLGCTSYESCRSFCESNQQKCMEFARKHKLSDERAEKEGRRHEEEQKKFLEKAKTELGCDSQESCFRYCEQNQEKCSEFFRKSGGTTQTQPQGERPPCDSPESCRKYCEANPDKCPGYKRQEESRQEDGSRPTGPSGCRTEEECRKYYQEQRTTTTTSPQPTGSYNYPTPSGYQNYPTGTGETTSQPTHDPSSSCTSYGCSWTGTTCNCPERVQGASTTSQYDFHFQYLIELQNSLN